MFSNLFVAIAITALWPVGLLAFLAFSAWLERRTLATEEVVPRRIRHMDRMPPDAVEAMVLQETAYVVAEYWSATGRPLEGEGAVPSEAGGQPVRHDQAGRNGHARAPSPPPSPARRPGPPRG